MVAETSSTLQAEITRRLRRLEGQARGIQKMLDEGRDCEEMLTQTMAIRSAVDQVGARLMEYHVDRCLLNGFDCQPEQMERLRESMRLWIRFVAQSSVNQAVLRSDLHGR